MAVTQTTEQTGHDRSLRNPSALVVRPATRRVVLWNKCIKRTRMFSNISMTYFFPYWTTLPVSIWVKNCEASLPRRSEQKCCKNGEKLRLMLWENLFKSQHKRASNCNPSLTCSTRMAWWSFALFCNDIKNPFMLVDPMLSSRKSAYGNKNDSREKQTFSFPKEEKWNVRHTFVVGSAFPERR